MHLIDTHAHLYAEEFNEDRHDMIRRATDAGVGSIILPNIDSTTLNPMIELTAHYPELCYASAGLHPSSVKENYVNELNKMEDALSKKKFCAIGETGLDFYWDKTFAEEQKTAFRKQLEWAAELNLPIIIHTRNAFDATYKLVSEFRGRVSGIFHCFSGSAHEAEKIISLTRFKLGIGGVLTYKNSKLPEVIREIDLKHLVLETDAPYLTPVPHRGKRNESAYISHVAHKLAEIKSIPIDEIISATTLNANEIFNLQQ